MTYDEWVLRGPEEQPEIGTEDGETCGRYAEPDEDAPRGYKPKPCKGAMELSALEGPDETWVQCDTCGEIA